MIIERLERPLGAVVDLDELKSLARVEYDEEDWLLSQMGHAAAREAEDLAEIALLSQAVRVTLDGWPRTHSFRLPIGPLLDWTSVTVTADGQPFEAFSTTTGTRPELRATARPSGRIVIEYVAGYGETRQTIPEDLLHAITDQALAYFEARGPGDPKQQAQSPHFARIIGRRRGVRA